MESKRDMTLRSDGMVWKASEVHICVCVWSVWFVTGQGWGLARAGDWGCCLCPCDPGECQPWLGHSLACRRLAECLLSVTRSSSQPSGRGTSSAQGTRHSHLGQTQQHTLWPPYQTSKYSDIGDQPQEHRSIGLDQWSGKWPRDVRHHMSASLPGGAGVRKLDNGSVLNFIELTDKV